MQVAQEKAVAAVGRVLAGQSLATALAAVEDGESREAGRRAALVRELAYGTLRHWGTLDAIVRIMARAPLTDPAVPVLLAVALYQLEHTRAPPFAVVDHAVGAAGRLARPAAKGFVNAILRRFLRERDDILRRIATNPVARWSHPAWWVDRVRREYPEHWERILAAGNERPPLTLRVNARRSERAELLRRFGEAGVDATGVGASGIKVHRPRVLLELPGFVEGEFSVQDAGAQLAAPLLAPQDGMRVLDACAAPGGKSTHIAEIADVELVALDRDAGRLARVAENFTRLGLSSGRLRLEAADAATPATWWDGRLFDRILADVPCSASGVVRRHPDGKWLRRESDIAAFVGEQSRLLESLWPLLAPGGRFVYATCSVFAEENESGVAAFLARHPEARREPLQLPPEVDHVGGQLLPTLPGSTHDQDGFYYAVLSRP